MILPRRRVAPLLLALLLIAGPLAAAPHRPHEAWQSRLSVTGLLSMAWDFLSSTSPFAKEGGSGDPFGKSGSSIDPFGNPTSNTQPPPASSSASSFAKSGSSSDPFGNPKPSSQSPADSTSSEP